MSPSGDWEDAVRRVLVALMHAHDFPERKTVAALELALPTARAIFVELAADVRRARHTRELTLLAALGMDAALDDRAQTSWLRAGLRSLRDLDEARAQAH